VDSFWGLFEFGWISEGLLQFGQEPLLIYAIIFAFMFASSFGLPCPEEVLIVAVGVLAFTLTHSAGPAEVSWLLSPVPLAITTFLAVFMSDLLVFFIGRKLRPQLEKIPFFKKRLRRRKDDTVRIWMGKYGHWSAGLFRFTPGMRFPGHMACGMLGVRPLSFALIDGTAALLSVPTQILFIAYFGSKILSFFKIYQVPSMIILTVVVGLIVYLAISDKKASPRRQYSRRSRPPQDQEIQQRGLG